jgi:hypothetical protein
MIKMRRQVSKERAFLKRRRGEEKIEKEIKMRLKKTNNHKT